MKNYLIKYFVAFIFLSILISTNVSICFAADVKPATKPTATGGVTNNVVKSVGAAAVDSDDDEDGGKRNPIKKEFILEMPLSKLNPLTFPSCRALFTKNCGQEDFPQLLNFSQCLQEKFDSFKQNPDCGNLAHALVFVGFLSRIARSISSCQVYYEKCQNEYKKNKSIGPIGCVLREPGLPSVCYKLANDSYVYRISLGKMYDERLAPDLKYLKNKK